MIRINENYTKLQSSYLFSTISKKVQEYQANHPQVSIIRLGIGDVTKALSPTIIKGFHLGVDEMAQDSTFKGYGPEQGYDFLRKAIAQVDFVDQGAQVQPHEVFVSDGAKCDTGNFQELFALDIKIAVPDPVYPVYVDTNVMAGRTGKFVNGRYEGLIYLESNEANNFVPSPESLESSGNHPDLIYLCFPNNPTGATATKDQLSQWVEYALDHKALILFDAAYAQFIRDPSLPKSIFEIPDARKVAVEFRSLSKTAGFTGTRAAYTVIPEECKVWDTQGKEHSLHGLWNRRQTTKFNGVSFPVQRAAAAVYTPEGQKEIQEQADYYLANAKLIRSTMESMGYPCTGGENSPYIWIKTGQESWGFFDTLLEKAGVVTTPGSGFGICGEGYIRISAFNHREKVEEALERIKQAL